MDTFNVELPDGRVLEGIPVGTTRAQIEAKIGKVSETVEPAKPISIGAELGKVADKIGRGGAFTFPGMAGDAVVWSAQKLREGAATAYNRVGAKTGAYTPDAKMPDPVRMWPSDALAEITGGPIGKPETGIGKTVAGVGETIVGTMMGAGPASKLKSLATLGAASGLGAETGAAFFGDSPGVRMAGGLAGGLPVGIAQAYKGNNTAKVAREVFAGISDDELEAAIQTAAKSKTAGLDLLPNQALGRESNLDALVSALASTKEGKNTTNTLRSQPLQIQLETELLKSKLPGETRALRDINNRGQETASDVIKQGQKQATAAWQAAAPQGAVIPESALAAFDKQLAQIAARYPNTARAEMVNDVRTAIRNQQPPTPASTVLGPDGRPAIAAQKGPTFLTDALQAKGAIDDVLQNFGARKLNTPGTTGKELQTAQEIRELFNKQGGVLETHAPDLVAANRAYENVMNTVVNPTKKSIIGELAGRSGAVADVNAPQGKLFSVFNAGTHPEATRSEILSMQAGLAKSDPTVFTDAAKTWLSTKISDAFEGKGARTAPNIAARLTDALGSPQQASSASQGLKDTLVGMARSEKLPDETYLALPKFLHYVALATERPSNTGGITSEAIKELASSSVFGSLGHVSALTFLRQPLLAYSRLLGRNTQTEIDRLLTSPEGIRMLHTLSKTSPHSDTGRKAIELFLSTDAAAQSGE